MLLRQVVDELLDENRLAYAGTAEQAGLAAADERLDEVDDLDAGLEDLGARGERVVLGREMVDGHPLLDFGHRLLIDGLADDVPDAAERAGAYGHLDGSAGILNIQAADETVG